MATPSDVPADDYAKGEHYAVLGYKVGPRVLDVSRDLNFVSMKDQIIRGRWAVDALVEAKGLTPDNLVDDGNECELLVIGAGAAGVSAAMRAADRHVRTLLIDREAEPFTRQAQSDRLISMSLYDWPAQHWDKAPWPHDQPVSYPNATSGSSMLTASPRPAGHVVGSARALASEWLTQFQAMQSASPFLRFWPLCGLESPTPIKESIGRPGRMKVRLRFGDGSARGGDDVTVFPQFVLLALGPGIERVSVKESGGGEYAGPRFWVAEYREDQNGHPVGNVDVDPLLADPILNQAGEPVETLVVSGAGDGGVQDFIRAVLKPEFHDLQEIVKRLSVIEFGAWIQLERDVAAAELQTERARQLGAADIKVFQALHERTETAVITWMSKDHWMPGEEREKLIRSEIAGMLRKPMPAVIWVLGARETVWFDKTYALNRVLGILLLRCTRSFDFLNDDDVVTVLKKLKSMTRAAEGWTVHLSDERRPVESVESFDADLVIPRHGVQTGAARLNRGRQRYVGLRKAFERLVPPFKPLG